eukprot:1008457-Rhodomonas_salina.2
MRSPPPSTNSPIMGNGGHGSAATTMATISSCCIMLCYCGIYCLLWYNTKEQKNTRASCHDLAKAIGVRTPQQQKGRGTKRHQGCATPRKVSMMIISKTKHVTEK